MLFCSVASFRAVALSYLLLPSSARVIWIPEDFDPNAGVDLIARRSTSTTCGGMSNLQQCGSSFPSDFCCPTDSRCLPLNGTTAMAVICCPVGETCHVISPVSCDQRSQDPAQAPESEIHSSPSQELETCGSARCCPMGYSCQGSQCKLQSTSISSTTVTTTTTTSAMSTTSTSSLTSTTSPPLATTEPSTSPLRPTSSALPTTTEPSKTNSDNTVGYNPASRSFSGKSFAAGFVPGIALGAILVALLLLCLFRRKSDDSRSQLNEKANSRDTLTDLSTLPLRPPITHSRSISEPTMDPSSSYRTDFLRGTPPCFNEMPGSNASTTSDNFQTPTSGSSIRTPKLKAIFSHSPFLDPAPSTPAPSQVPSHLKRGTLSFKITPVRTLKKQRSVHSLRRQMTTASHTSNTTSRSNSNRRSGLNRNSRSRSTETIQVLMPTNEPYTPDHHRQHQPAPPPHMKMPMMTRDLDEPSYDLPDSATSWETDGSGAERPTPDQRAQSQLQTVESERQLAPHVTPTRSTDRNRLGSPYTPSNARNLRVAKPELPQLQLQGEAKRELPLALMPHAPPPLRISSVKARREQGVPEMIERKNLPGEGFGKGKERAR